MEHFEVEALEGQDAAWSLRGERRQLIQKQETQSRFRALLFKPCCLHCTSTFRKGHHSLWPIPHPKICQAALPGVAQLVGVSSCAWRGGRRV